MIKLKQVPTLESLFAQLKKDDKALLDAEQIKKLTSLKFSDGEPVLSLENRPFVYEIASLLLKTDWDTVYSFLQSKQENLKTAIIMSFPTMKDTETKFLNNINIYKNTIEVTAGEKCKKCGSIETISVEKQTRSQDEAASIRITCLQCRHHWNAQ